MKRKIVVLGVLLCLCSGLLAGCKVHGDVKVNGKSILNKESPSTEAPASEVEAKDSDVKVEVADVTESTEMDGELTSDNVTLDAEDVAWSDGAFTLEGVDYVLGGSIEDYEANGWVFDKDFNETEMVTAGDLCSMRFMNDGKSMYLMFNNENAEDVSCYELKVMGVEVDTTCVGDLQVHGAGIGSSYDEVYETIGKCNQKYTTSTYRSLTYETTDTDISVDYSFYDNSDICTGVTYMNWKYGGL